MLHDRNDDIVPISQGETYVARATSLGDDARLDVVPGTHFSHIKPRSRAVKHLRVILATL